MNLGLYTARSARFWPDRPAIKFRERSLTFLELERRSNRLAHALLGLGLVRGDRVAVVSANRPELVELECALYKAGLVKVALNARLAPAELADALANSDPTACLAAPAHQAHVDAVDLPGLRHRIALQDASGGAVAPDAGATWLDYEALLVTASDAHIAVDMHADDLAVLHYTSGSTGRLKAAMQTVGNRMASLRKVVMGRMRCGPGDTLGLSGPITHASGMFMQPCLYQGATVLLHERFDPEALLRSIGQHRVTMTYMVPAMMHTLMADPALRRNDLSSLRLLSYGAAPMSPERIREAWACFGPVLAQGYGAGETTGGLVGLSIEDHSAAIYGGRPELLGSCGRPFGESDVQVLGDGDVPVQGDAIGEICVRGPDVFAGYWRAPELTSEAIVGGWLRTGDLARVDHEGYLHIVDRKKEMVVSGGFNVYPTEVESVLARHPAVYEVSVVGVPDERWGEAVKAVIVLRGGTQATETELIEFCRGTLADFKRPKSVDFVDELPKSANGKLSRKAVRERYWQGRERRVN